MSGITAGPSAPSALLTFGARNVRSYWNDVHFSLVGTRLSDAGILRSLSIAGTRTPVGVLPAAGIFGANASGKSTVLRAMADMRAVVIGSFRQGDRQSKIHRHPFLLHKGGAERPSRFDVDLVLKGVRWQYGFEIDDQRVLDEYAYYYPKGRQALVLRRDGGGRLEFGPTFRSSGHTLARLARSNALLLSVAGAASDDSTGKSLEITSSIGPLYSWFRNSLRLMERRNMEPRIAVTADRARSLEARDDVLALLQAADLGIADMEIFKPDLDPKAAELLKRAFRIIEGHGDTPREGQEEKIVIGELVRLKHMGRDGPVVIDPEHESQGTLVWVSLIGPVLEALERGATVLLDELDASLHPHLAQRLIGLFQDPYTNPNCAQLVFSAHDVTILGDSAQRTLGRDQIWFAEKEGDGTTALYPLADFRPKGDEAIGRRYLQGRYGGVPVLDPAEFRRIPSPTRT